MSDDYHHLPIMPASGSLASHLQALDLLAARLSSLTTRSEWETRIPLNSKASMMGKIVETGNVKINIGGDWWVDMTPQEGEAWVRRRKTSLLEEHAKVLEGWRPGQTSNCSTSKQAPTNFEPRFDPLFRSPIQATASTSTLTTASPAQTVDVESKAKNPTQQSPAAKSKTTVQATGKTKEKEGSPTPAPAPAPVPAKAAATSKPTQNAKAGPSQPKPPSAPSHTIQDILNSFMENQDNLAKGTGKAGMQNVTPVDVMTNDEGLPIHEIREDENGQLIGELPAVTAGSSADISSGSGSAVIEEIPVDDKNKDDFWSEAAIARREALRRKVFDDPSDSESDADADAEEAKASTSTPLAGRPNVNITTTTTTTDPTSSGPSINAIPPTPSSPTSSPDPPVRRPSSSALPPKSILKSSAPRKKSVSFDSSVPEPPESPASTPTPDLRIGGSMFPTPVINIESEIQEREVPTLNAPKRSPKRSTFGDPFAGFKPGFLGGNGKLSTPTGAGAGNVSEEPSTMGAAVKEVPVGEEAPKKQSRFAQRQREAETTPSTPGPASASAPSFPSMSTSKGTSSVKNVVLEKPSPTPSSPSVSGSASRSTPAPQFPSDSGSSTKTSGTAGVAQTVTERTQPVAGPSRLNGKHQTRDKSPLSQSQSNQYKDEDQYEDESDDEDDDEDDDDFYADDDDGSEGYDLDDAMLAREVALAYHQNLAYSELARSQTEGGGLDEDEQTVQDYLAQLQLQDDEGAEAEGDQGVEGGGEGRGQGAGVMMALPQISILGTGTDQRPRIINPTPDNLRKFVRVGKLDNGKLVLAPGESGWSDEEDDDDGEAGVGVGGDHVHQSVPAGSAGRGSGTAVKHNSGKAGGESVRKRENREEIRRALLGGQKFIEQTPAPPPKLVEGEMGLPPTIGIGPTPTKSAVPATPAVGSVKESLPKTVPVNEKPKKVSRFKADRMNG